MLDLLHKRHAPLVVALLSVTFTAERLGSDKVRVKDQDLALDRYRLGLRDGDYLVWATPAGAVYKVLPPAGKNAVPVVLEGYQDATRDLK